MMKPRKFHTGKTSIERIQYKNSLQSWKTEESTIEEYESTPTDSIVQEEPCKISTIPQPLKPYKPIHNLPWREILVSIISVAFIGIFGYFTMTLNREVGVLSERFDSTSSNVLRLEKNYDSVREDIQKLQVDIGIIEQNIKNGE